MLFCSNIRERCPVCNGSGRAQTYYHHLEGINGVSLFHDFAVVVCADCGMIYAAGNVSQDQADGYYSRYSKYETKDMLEDSENARVGFVEFIQSQIPDKSTNILDIGCGYGVDLLKLKDVGYTNLAGCDLSQENCLRLKIEFGIPSINKSLFDINVADLPFTADYIILNGVMEHIIDLQTASRRLKSLLSPGGKLIIVVPYVNRFLEGAKYPFGEISMEHVNYFTLNSLSRLMIDNGLVHDNHTVLLMTQSSYCLVAVFSYYEVTLAEPMSEYIEACERNIDNMVQVIDEYVNSQSPIILWGAGTLCQYLFANTKLSQCNILSIVDSNNHYWDHTLKGYYINNPSILCGGSYNKSDIFVISYHFGDEIVAKIRAMQSETKLKCGKIVKFPLC
jgi:SAM-dependent methyltransferase